MEIDALSLDLQNKSYDFNPFTEREGFKTRKWKLRKLLLKLWR